MIDSQERSQDDRIPVLLPSDLVSRAREIGLNVQKSCKVDLQERVRALQGEVSQPSKRVNSSDNINTKSSQTGAPAEQNEKEFLKDFSEACRIDWDLADSTTKERMRYARKLVEYLDGHPCKATKKDLRGFIEKFEDDNAIKTVRVIYSRYLNSEIADSFKVPQSSIQPHEIPSKKDLKETFENLECLEVKTSFLMWATSGLRRGELLNLKMENVDLEKRMLTPDRHSSTKNSWVTFYNEEVEEFLHKLLREKDEGDIFTLHPDTHTTRIGEASEDKITPQNLRQWFAEEMTNLGISERYVDAFCGRTPRSELGRHYSDYSPSKMKERYESVNLEVLE